MSLITNLLLQALFLKMSFFKNEYYWWKLPFSVPTPFVWYKLETFCPLASIYRKRGSFFKKFYHKKKNISVFYDKKFDNNVHQLQRNYCKIKKYQTGSSKTITPSYLFFLHSFLMKLLLFETFLPIHHNMSKHQGFFNSPPPFLSHIFHGNFFFSFNLKVTQKYLFLNIFILTCNFKK